jgi:signal transduction histidine kinase
VLSEQGLDAAVRTLAEHAPIPVTVEARGERLPELVETAAYFVVSEALANIAKYAHASQAWVSVGKENGNALIRVRDDGIGGADPTSGSGLLGLADRISAINGQLRIDSPVGAGTTIHAEIPCPT